VGKALVLLSTSSSQDVLSAVTCLQRGEVIVTPSESCYGLSCDATNKDAVAKLNALKGEREGMSLTILISSLSQVTQFALMNPHALHLSHAFHPGPLNLIVEQKNAPEYSYLSPNGIAFRIPKHPILLTLIERFGHPITTTSANLHGEPPLYAIESVKAVFGGKVCNILDDGDLSKANMPSTVYDTRSGQILREGPISYQQIEIALRSHDDH